MTPTSPPPPPPTHKHTHTHTSQGSVFGVLWHLYRGGQHGRRASERKREREREKGVTMATEAPKFGSAAPASPPDVGWIKTIRCQNCDMLTCWLVDLESLFGHIWTVWIQMFKCRQNCESEELFFFFKRDLIVCLLTYEEVKSVPTPRVSASNRPLRNVQCCRSRPQRSWFWEVPPPEHGCKIMLPILNSDPPDVPLTIWGKFLQWKHQLFSYELMQIFQSEDFNSLNLLLSNYLKLENCFK